MSRISTLLGVSLAVSFLLSAPVRSDSGSQGSLLIADKTREFHEKEGFERQPKDIINTLKNNEYASFQTLLDGLQQAFDLDKTLKNKGPFTLFAPSDKAFKTIPDEDVQALFANKKKLKQVLSYHIVSGKFSAKFLRELKTLKTIEGHKLTLSTKNGNLHIDKALVQTADIPCSNGTIHIVDSVLMPPLSK